MEGTKKEGLMQALPGEMRQMRRFVLWGVKGKPAKLPFTVKNGRLRAAKPGDAGGCLTFEEAAAEAEKRGCGVGFVFCEGDGLTGVDLDHVAQDGQITDETARQMVDDFTVAGAYLEYSQSGEGIHAICRATLPAGAGNRRGAFEFYDRGRYFALTGNALTTPEHLADCQPLVEGWHRRIFGENIPAGLAPQGKGQALSDEELGTRLAAALGRDYDLQGLFNLTDHPGPLGDESRQDLALCSALARTFPDDPDAVLRAADLSPWVQTKDDHHAEKWTRADYRRNTAQRGIIVRRAKEVEQMDGITAEVLPDLPKSAGAAWSDLNAGRLFSEFVKPTGRYCPQWKAWVYYDGVRWREDVGGLRTAAKVKELADSLPGRLGEVPEEKRGQFLGWCSKWQSSTTRARIVDDARSEPGILVDASAFDASPWLLNVSNGTVDLRTGELRPHNPDDLLTKLAPVRYDPEAQGTRWRQFVGEVFPGQPDMARLFQQACGYALTGSTERECLFILYGPSTRNGKSTACETIAALLGDYARSADPSLLAPRSNTPGAASADLADLVGARFVTLPEPEAGSVWSAASIKRLTGGDTITARKLYGSPFEFRPQGKFFVNSNHLPRLSDHTIFASDRVKIVLFPRHFEEGERDPLLKTDLCSVESLSGVLNWCLEGLQDFTSQGRHALALPAASQAVLDEFRRDSDKLGRFIEEACVVDDLECTRTEEMYCAYSAWCTLNGHRVESQGAFNKLLAERFELKRQRPQGGGNPMRMVLGLGLQNRNSVE